MKAIIVIMALLLTGISFAGERRYVVATKTLGITVNSYALWTNKQWRDACAGARKSVILSGKAKSAEDVDKDPDVQRACEVGVGPIKPTVGVLNVGAQVELLDSRECNPLVYVRVLNGKLSGSTGCIEAEALSSQKP